ncbi:GNAT family N-acetyltransferase [Alicyclobacillus dauci]|uniref:GNAT family N-acetyltransferase n=1 Tax=Alicyclobacillus dauci TaxID=1475485 RepID=A0ABY6Z7D9_9BACL|nr:GNAT family N-acetyltransferase [Alicyclobacillus dauci]WAH38806.1 GNAT family N-acetyltransferase [Alicyclobacillus dauci]
MADHWYERLENYFPEEELKSVGQMKDLLEDQVAYRKEQTDEYLLMYAEFEDFLFIDYLLVNPKTRGSGIGTKLMNRLKARDKTLLAEVEPASPEDIDTEKRVRFYVKNGFKRADNIEYTRETDDGKTFSMDIYYWSPDRISEEKVLSQMEIVCDEIHNFRARKHYGRIPADPDEVLKWKQ